MQDYTLAPQSEDAEVTKRLKIKIEQLKETIQSVQYKIHQFENFLKTHLMDEIILSQELYALYKSQKKAKKEKRALQKKSKFSQPALVSIAQKSSQQTTTLVYKKKLYKEAMAKVHPDKFYQMDEAVAIANELSLELIKIYQEGTLVELEQFHQQVFKANSIHQIKFNQERYLNSEKSLKEQLQDLQIQLEVLTKSQLWYVLETYENPYSFLEELKEYYADRIFKLKKRTRTL